MIKEALLAAGKAAFVHHRRVAAFYRAVTGPGVVHLDASRPLDEVVEAAWGAIERVANHGS